MSLLNKRLPGLLPKVECTPTLMPCMIINDIPYIFFCISNLSPYMLYIYFVLATCPYIYGNVSPCIWQSVLRIFPIVNHSFTHSIGLWVFAVVHTSLMWQFCNSVWNSGPVNSVPGSCTQRWGHGQRVSQHCANFLATVCDLLSLILMSLTKLVIVSITESTSNSYGSPRTWTVQGPIRSVAHSSNGTSQKL